jgi:hypothetical protein
MVGAQPAYRKARHGLRNRNCCRHLGFDDIAGDAKSKWNGTYSETLSSDRGGFHGPSFTRRPGIVAPAGMRCPPRLCRRRLLSVSTSYPGLLPRLSALPPTGLSRGLSPLPPTYLPAGLPTLRTASLQQQPARLSGERGLPAASSRLLPAPVVGPSARGCQRLGGLQGAGHQRPSAAATRGAA